MELVVLRQFHPCYLPGSPVVGSFDFLFLDVTIGCCRIAYYFFSNFQVKERLTENGIHSAIPSETTVRYQFLPPTRQSGNAFRYTG